MANSGGVYRGIVTDDVDPTGDGRVQVRIPALGDEAWAPVVGMPVTAGATVLVALEDGDPAFPVVLGALTRPGAGWALPGGLTLTLAAGTATLTDAGGTRVSMGPAGVRVVSASTAEITASTVEIAASTVRVDAAIVKMSGVLQVDALIANSVASASYTPGAGNIW